MPGYPNRSFDAGPLAVRLEKAQRKRKNRLASLINGVRMLGKLKQRWMNFSTKRMNEKLARYGAVNGSKV